MKKKKTYERVKEETFSNENKYQMFIDYLLLLWKVFFKRLKSFKN